MKGRSNKSAIDLFV